MFLFNFIRLVTLQVYVPQKSKTYIETNSSLDFEKVTLSKKRMVV